jgi:hypothetical protein
MHCGTTENKMDVCQVWWSTPVMSAFRRLRQEDHDFKASLI